MTYTVDYFVLGIIILCNALLFGLLYLNITQGIRRIYFILCSIPVCIYSGIGNAYQEIGSEYLFKYLLFSSLLMLSLFVVFKLSRTPNIIDFCHREENTSTPWIYAVFSILFLMTFFVYLLFPEIRLYHLWAPPAANVIGGYERIDYNKSHFILNLASALRPLLLPFFMINLQLLKEKRKNISIFVWIVSWVYLYYLSQEYISRYELLVFLLFAGILLSSRVYWNYQMTRKHFIMIVAIFLLVTPFLVNYQYIRQGLEIPNIDYVEAFLYLGGIETDFPKYYFDIEHLSSQVSPLRYFLWFLLLPVPSIIYADKAEASVAINQVFSSNYLNLERGASGYYGLVPSIFGESMLIYNSDFFWIHALFLGIVIARICVALENIPELSTLNLYYAVNVIALARGGSQGYFGPIILTIFFFLLIKAFIIQHTSHKKKRGL